MTATIRPLTDVLASRRWTRRSLPFPHVVATDVFVPEVYRELETAFRRVETDHPEAFRRSMAGYDASASELDRYRDGPLGIFASRPWHDLLAEVSGVGVAGTTGDVTASLHHHDVGGASGWPHNDLNPGWFPGEEPGSDEVRMPGDGEVSYHHGPGDRATPARETVRAVSLLFYLANPPWQPGDGGETGLYRAAADTAPTARVPPHNNSLVLFECTPVSWHGFLSNVRSPRNSIVMWLHRPVADVAARWGEQSIARW